jgi:hypothetical protein
MPQSSETNVTDHSELSYPIDSMRPAANGIINMIGDSLVSLGWTKIEAEEDKHGVVKEWSHPACSNPCGWLEAIWCQQGIEESE